MDSLLPLAQKMFAKTIVLDLISVKPMSSPSGGIFGGETEEQREIRLIEERRQQIIEERTKKIERIRQRMNDNR